MRCSLSVSLLLALLTLVFPILLEARRPGSRQSNPTLEQITFKSAVLHAPPFATVEDMGGGQYEYGGVQIDLLNSMKQFALQDNILVNFDLVPSPPQYGAAFNLVANDCNTTANPNPLEACNALDIIVANFYSTPDRALRSDLSPTWMRSTISTMKYKDPSKTLRDVTTMQQAAEFGVAVCLKTDTFYAGVVAEKFPTIIFVSCDDQDICIAKLKAQECGLYASDELQLRYRAANDASLAVTPESFNTQYITWAFKDDTPNIRWVRKWIYQAVINTTMDQLYFEYFQKELCPVGSAGESCQLPCDPDHGKADETGKCVCESTKYRGDDCSIEIPENKNLISTGLKAMAYFMVAVNYIVIIGLVAWMIFKKKSHQIRLSQPFFLLMILLGCGISTSTILAMMSESEGDGPVRACMAVPWLYSVGFSITFGCLFAKIRRVYLIFKSAADFRRSKVTFGETCSITAAVLLVDVTILMVWSIVDPLHWERTITSSDKFGVPLSSEGICTCQYWEVWVSSISLLHGGLLAIACYLCYQARDIPTKFSEGKYVSIAMFSNLQIFVVGLPILVILGSDSSAGFFVRTVVIWMNDLVVVVLIFGNLIYHVHFHPSNHRVDKEDVSREIGSAIQKFSMAKKERSERNSSSSDSSERTRRSAKIAQFGTSSEFRLTSRASTGSRFEMPSVAELSDEDETSESLHFTVADSNTLHSDEEKKESSPVPSVAKPAEGLGKSSWGGLDLKTDSSSSMRGGFETN
ncbi:unnamed protein product [Cylindrotheca closterium]|uniref:G-protein coupled receptors family 3 profile domain-containing protein n=1 Tax=Cylindrotheca closterium TaxID=2856 RepID=A0AAD2JMN4_9STRA|nr:unnamed protein product [Cylindrotheca closterium]